LTFRKLYRVCQFLRGKRISIAALVLFAVLPIHAVSKEQSIHALRSAYLYYFSHFVTWPVEAVFPQKSVWVCVLTTDENDRFQLLTIDKKSLGDRSLRIRFLDDSGDMLKGHFSECNMIYIAQSNAVWLESNRNLMPATALLVTEGKLSEKGLIHLHMQDKKLKFEIDNDQLAARNFKVSSKLLRLSRKAN